MGCIKIGASVNANVNADQEVRFILCPARNTTKLQNELSDLKGLRTTTEKQIEEMQGEPGVQIGEDVRAWLKDVDDIDKEVRELLMEISGGGCTLRRFCCCLFQNYSRGEAVHNKLERVRQLKNRHKDWNGKLSISIQSHEPAAAKLRTEVGRLRDLRICLERKVEEMKMDRPVETLESVTSWMGEVGKIQADAEEVTEEKSNEMLDRIARMRKRVEELVKQHDDLKSGELVTRAKLERVELNSWSSLPLVVGVDNMVSEILAFLDRDEVQILGIYGTGGVGKTTLMGELNKRFKQNDSPCFDLVICVEVKREADIIQIQEDVGRRLGYSRSGEDGPHLRVEVRDRAKQLVRCISEKKCLLLLDDVCETIDLGMIGVPPESSNKCKVVLTTRDEQVCNDMGVHKVLQLDFMNASHSRELFRGTIRRDDLLEQEDIRSLEESIVCNCGGLPSVIVTVARAMRVKESVLEWEVARDVLDDFSAEIRDSGAGVDLLSRLYQELACRKAPRTSVMVLPTSGCDDASPASAGSSRGVVVQPTSGCDDASPASAGSSRGVVVQPTSVCDDASPASAGSSRGVVVQPTSVCDDTTSPARAGSTRGVVVQPTSVCDDASPASAGSSRGVVVQSTSVCDDASTAFAGNVNNEVRFILCPKHDTMKLQNELSELKGLGTTTEKRIEEMQGEPGVQIREDVRSWLKDIDDVDKEVSELLKEIADGRFTYGRFCCCLCQNYSHGEAVHNKLERVRQLKNHHKDWNGQLSISIQSHESAAAKLRTEVGRLRDLRICLERKVEEMKMDRPVETLESVTSWMGEVGKIQADAEEVTEEKSNEMLDRIARMRKRVEELVKQHDDLKSGELVTRAKLERVELNPWSSLPPVYGMDKIVSEILAFLDSDDDRMLGIYGMGCDGKTALMGELNKRLEDSPDFDLVICVDVKREADIIRIQEVVGRRLGYSRSGEDGPHLRTEVPDRAKQLVRCISEKKCLLLLDDVCEKIDLGMIGVPPESSNKCKVVLTTRDEQVCNDMGVHRKLRWDLINATESWTLFCGWIQRDDLLAQRDIRSLAYSIVGKCGGIPRVIATVALAMKMKKSALEWEVARDVLDDFSAEIRESGAGADLLSRLSAELACRTSVMVQPTFVCDNASSSSAGSSPGKMFKLKMGWTLRTVVAMALGMPELALPLY